MTNLQLADNADTQFKSRSSSPSLTWVSRSFTSLSTSFCRLFVSSWSLLSNSSLLLLSSSRACLRNSISRSYKEWNVNILFSEWFCKNLSTLIIRSTLCSSNLFFSAWASLNIRSISSIFTMLAVLVLHRHTKDFCKTDHWWISMSSALALNMGLHSKLYNYFCFPKKSEFKALHLIWQSALEHLKVRLLGDALECNKNSTDRICVYLDYISGDSCLFNFLNIYTYKRN